MCLFTYLKITDCYFVSVCMYVCVRNKALPRNIKLMKHEFSAETAFRNSFSS